MSFGGSAPWNNGWVAHSAPQNPLLSWGSLCLLFRWLLMRSCLRKIVYPFQILDPLLLEEQLWVIFFLAKFAKINLVKGMFDCIFLRCWIWLLLNFSFFRAKNISIETKQTMLPSSYVTKDSKISEQPYVNLGISEEINCWENKNGQVKKMNGR